MLDMEVASTPKDKLERTSFSPHTIPNSKCMRHQINEDLGPLRRDHLSRLHVSQRKKIQEFSEACFGTTTYRAPVVGPIGGGHREYPVVVLLIFVGRRDKQTNKSKPGCQRFRLRAWRRPMKTEITSKHRNRNVSWTTCP